MGRLRPPILCRLLQEAAAVHAAKLGVAVETLIDGGVAWVLSRLQLSVRRWPRAEEEVVVETWPAAANRLFTERRFEFRDPSGNVIATAATLWFILDLETRRAIRLPPTILDALDRLDLESAPMRPGALETPEPGDTEVEFTVRRSDLDLAGHVNNTSYVEWVIEAVSDKVWSVTDLAELEIAFLSECHHGQSIVSTSQTRGSAEAFEIRHSVLRRDGGEEVARARTVWRPVG